MTETALTRDGPPPILDADELISQLASADELLLDVDFGGTLTAVADDPNDPEITATNRRALRQLADARNARVAVVSGRALSDLHIASGSTGSPTSATMGANSEVTTGHPAAERNRPIIQDLIEALENRLADVDGCIIEDKGVTATVHYRKVAADRGREVQKTVRSIVSERAPDRVRVQTGKAVMELRPAVPHDKGTVVRQLADEVASGWFTLYVGDDATDEDAFVVLADVDDSLGILVGDDSTTAADRRLPDPAAVERTLAWLADEGIVTFE